MDASSDAGSGQEGPPPSRGLRLLRVFEDHGLPRRGRDDEPGVGSLGTIPGSDIIAAPAGIVTVEMGRPSGVAQGRGCTRCGQARHDDARHCKRFGERLG